VFAFSFPAFSRLAAQGDAHKGEIAQAYRAYLIAIGVTAIGIAVVMMGSWSLLLRVFAGTGSANGQFGAPGLLTLNFLLLACNVAPYYLLLALGRARAVSMITIVSMLAALVLMMFLIPRYGLLGAALSRLAYGVGALLLLQRARQMLKRT
jgi:O-antigen/teichoic acid export membrane protein